MIVLDTKIVSEPMKAQGNPAVTAWLDRQVTDTLYFTATSLSELLVGIELLPEGRRRSGLDQALSELVMRLFGPRIPPFDQQAATVYARLVGRARAAGHPITFAEGQIAAIAGAHGFTVATRNTAPFAAAGVPVIDPWVSR
jgi:predicted nucleic acid-binding protein